MEAFVLDSQFESIGILDSYDSFIWNEKYNQEGDFELVLPMSYKSWLLLKKNNRLWRNETKVVMIIEKYQLKTNAEDSDLLIVSGRSLESILRRRVIWKQTTLSGNIQNGIKQLIMDNAINPLIAARKINNLVFRDSVDPAITSLTMDESQYHGEELYEVIQSICYVFDIGFRIFVEGDQMIFELYAGVDRSFEQITNPYVVFSPNYDNLLTSDLVSSDKEMKNTALIIGEGEGTDRKTSTVGENEDLDRYEIFIDAYDISATTDSGTISDTQYTALLQQRGTEELVHYTSSTDFLGEVEPNSMFIYNKDYKMGDVVQLINAYGIEAQSRVTEFISSQDIDGYKEYPTFTMVK